MRFHRDWDFNPSNKVITLNDLRDDAETQEAIADLFVGASGELIGTTVDTATAVKLIMFGNQTVKAIPLTTPDPLPPTGLARTIKIASVTLTWTAATTPAASYDVFRDGVRIASSSGLSFRDGTVVAGNTYSYQLRTVDSYGQVSTLTAAVTAFVDPTLNVAPTVTVTSWPALAPTNGKTLLRVCGADPDAQSLLLVLGVDSGSVTPTDDPSIWYYTPA